MEDVGAVGVAHPERTDGRPVHGEPHELRAQRQVPRDFLRKGLLIGCKLEDVLWDQWVYSQL